jgi:hypothetical protein
MFRIAKYLVLALILELPFAFSAHCSASDQTGALFAMISRLSDVNVTDLNEVQKVIGQPFSPRQYNDSSGALDYTNYLDKRNFPAPGLTTRYVVYHNADSTSARSGAVDRRMATVRVIVDPSAGCITREQMEAYFGRAQVSTLYLQSTGKDYLVWRKGQLPEFTVINGNYDSGRVEGCISSIGVSRLRHTGRAG